MSPGNSAGRVRLPPWMAVFGVWVGLFGLSLGFQWHSGAWESDFGGHADEAAHVVTGLMVRDYLAGGFLGQWHPLRYAETYYERFPKVAIGHYPPGFYVLEGFWLLPFRAPGAALVLMAALSGAGGCLTWAIGRRFLMGRGAALAMGVLFCLLPLVRTYTALVMSDLLLAILAVKASMAFGRFAEAGRARDSWAFGLWAASAILTKGSGLLLALVPPLTIALTGRWNVLKNPRLWLGAVPVVVLAMPWMLATRHITAEGMSEEAWSGYLARAAAFYLSEMVRELGILLSLLLLGALGAVFWNRWRGRGGVTPARAALWSLVIGLLVFYMAIPSGLDGRYLMPLLPAALILGAESMERWAGRFAPKVLPAAAVGMAVVVVVGTWRPVEKRFGGATESVSRVLADIGPDQPGGDTTVLVISDARGEGALTAAAAFAAPHQLRILRGTKVLSSSDWLGRGYEVKFSETEGLWRILHDRGIDAAIVEVPPGDDPWQGVAEHHQRAGRILADGGDLASLRGEVRSERKRDAAAAFRIYQFSPKELDAP